MIKKGADAKWSGIQMQFKYQTAQPFLFTVRFQVQTITDWFLPIQTECAIIESACRQALKIHRVLFTVDGLVTTVSKHPIFRLFLSYF